MEIHAINEKRTVLVDIDGVSADFEAPILAAIEQHHPHIKRLNPNEYPPSLYIHENYPAEHADTIWSVINEPTYERRLPLMPHVIEGWAALLEAGYDPRFCTTLRPQQFAPFCAENKLGWIREHFVPFFGEVVVANTVFSDKKHEVQGAVLIEDRPAPLKGAHTATWEHVVFDRPYNRNPESENLVRIQGWDDPDLIPKIDEAYHRHKARQQ